MWYGFSWEPALRDKYPRIRLVEKPNKLIKKNKALRRKKCIFKWKLVPMASKNSYEAANREFRVKNKKK